MLEPGGLHMGVKLSDDISIVGGIPSGELT